MDIHSIPRLAPGCRLHPTQDLLLVPEGTLGLSGPTRDILARLDGKKNVAAIIDDLLREFDGADRDEVRTDVLALLERLEQRCVVRTEE